MKYLSGREIEVNIGIQSYTNDKTVLEVIGHTNIEGNFNISGILTAAQFSGSGIGLTDIVSNQIVDVATDQYYYPMLSPVTSGIISNFSVSSRSIVFNPANSFLGIGTTNPQAPLDVWTGDGFVRFGDVTDINQTTDNGLAFIPSTSGVSEGGLTSYRSALFTEVNGRILSYGINVIQLESQRDTNFPGGIFRLDTRKTGGWSDSDAFVVKRQPVGLATQQGQGGVVNGIVVKLNTGDTYMVPNGGTMYVGAAGSTSYYTSGPQMPKMGGSNVKLQVGAASTPQDAYISGKLGIGSTNPRDSLSVVGGGTFSGIVTASAFVGSGAGLTGLLSNQIIDVGFDDIFYPVLSATTTGVLTSISVSSNSLSFNPSRGALGIRTSNPTSSLHFSGIGTTAPELGDNNRFRIGDFHWDNLYTTIHAKKVRSEWWLEQNSDDDDGVDMIFYKSRGWPNQETPVQLGDNVFRLSARAYKPGRTGIGSNITLSDWSKASDAQIEFSVDETTASEAFCSLDFKTKNLSRLIVKSGGNVGIASTLPTALFNVFGNAVFSGTGIVTAVRFVGDGSGLTNLPGGGGGAGAGTSLSVYDNYPTFVGLVTSIDFGSNLTVSSSVSGIVTVTASASGGSISNVIQDIDDNKFYYPLLSPITAGTISSISVSSQSIVFNPATNSLGIGTTNPQRLLHVLGYGLTNGIRVGDLDFFNFGIGSAAAGSPTFRSGISSGDTILRVVPNGSGKAQFEFFGNDYFQPGISTQWTNIRFNLVKNQTEFRIDTSQQQSKDVKPLVLEVGGNPNTDIPGLNPYQLYLSTEGKVGIGTSLPISKFTVQGDGAFAGVVTATAFVGSGSQLTGLNAAPSEISNIDNNAIYYPLLSPTSSGTISSISVSSNSIVFNPALNRLGIGTTNPLGSFQIGYAGTFASFIIDRNGNIGLGTVNPTSTVTEGVAHRTLHFYSPDSRQVSLRLDNGNTGGNAWLLQSSGGLAGNGQGKFSIYDVNSQSYRFTINPNGNIGVGEINPTSKLTVSGDVSIASTVSIGNSIKIIPYDNLNNGTLSFEGSAGQLFSITNNLTTGSIFSVNDVSGIPSIDVDANGTVQIAPYGGVNERVGIGTTNPTSKLTVTGNGLFTGIVTAAAFYGSGIGITGLVSNQIVNIDNNQVYYPILSPVSSGVITSFSVSNDSIVFNPALNYLGIGTTNPQVPLDLTFNTPTRNTAQFGGFGIQSFDNINGFISINGYWNGSQWVHRATGHSTLIQFISGQMMWRQAGNRTVGSATSDLSTVIKIDANRQFSINKEFNDNSNPHLVFDVRSPLYFDEYPYVSRKNPFLVGITTTGEVGIGTTNPTEKLHVAGNISINNITSYGSTSTTTATTSRVGIHSSLAIATYRSVEYTIQATQGTNYHVTKILVVHDGSDSYGSEYGTVYNNSPVATYSVDVSGGNMRLSATPASSSTTTYRINFVANKV